MTSRSNESEAPYKSENDNIRPDGDGRPPKPETTPGGSGGSGGGKTRTDPHTGAPTGGKPEAGG